MHMGHASKHVVEATCAYEGYNMAIMEKTENNTCDVCNAATQTKTAIKGQLVRLDDDITIHTDICGPVEIQTLGGERYFATFTTAKSRYYEVSLLVTRDQIGKYLEKFIAWAERTSGVSVKRIH